MSSKILSVKDSNRSRPRGNSKGRTAVLSPRQRTEQTGSQQQDAKFSDGAEERQFRGLPDKRIIAVTVALCMFGLMAVFSASAPEALVSFHDVTAELRKQTIACVIGMFFMFTVSRYDYRKMKKWAWPLAFLSIILLALTMVPTLSTEAFGAARWLKIGPFQFQPSELAKVSSIVLLASGLSKHFWWKRQMIFRIATVMVMAAIVVKQPDLGSTMMILSELVALLYVSGTNHLLLFGALTCSAALVWHKIQQTPYQMARIQSWLDPYINPQKEGWNIIQAQLAIGSGNWFGVGFGRSLQKLHYLPVQHADFIFAVIAEEIGFLGCLALISLFIVFGYYGFKVALDAKTLFGRLLAIGITSSICVQATVNIMVTTGCVPVTGITLPFISYGGSSLVITLFMVGILLSVSRDRNPKEDDDAFEMENGAQA